MPDEINVLRSVEIPTTAGKKLKLEQREDGVKVTYTGLRQPVVNLEHLRSAVAELGD